MIYLGLVQQTRDILGGAYSRSLVGGQGFLLTSCDIGGFWTIHPFKNRVENVFDL